MSIIRERTNISEVKLTDTNLMVRAGFEPGTFSTTQVRRQRSDQVSHELNQLCTVSRNSKSTVAGNQTRLDWMTSVIQEYTSYLPVQVIRYFFLLGRAAILKPSEVRFICLKKKRRQKM